MEYTGINDYYFVFGFFWDMGFLTKQEFNLLEKEVILVVFQIM